MSLRSFKLKSAGALVLLLLLLLSACGTSGNSTGSTGNNSKGKLTVASKLDVESQLLSKMYSLLLQKAGYQVNEKAALGNSNIVFQAISSGSIDLYPEFTATGLNKLQVPTTYDPQKDYQAVKDGFDKQYKLTWLDASPLNDGYELCTSKETSQKLGITSLSELQAKVSQLVLTSPSDGTAFVDGLKQVYNITTKSFKSTSTVDYALGFEAVKNDKAQITVCYGTDATVPQSGFIFLKDDKNGFPAFNPAPVVRNDILQKNPDIASVLNPLAPKLTTDVSIQLQQQVATQKKDGASVSHAVTQVATDFLKQQGLL
jgi:osmoprotectant transport system substrate-binding protein